MTGEDERATVPDGEMAALVRELDWSATPIGPREEWPSSLRAIVQTLLRSRHPMFLFWGPELIQFYNDAYRPSLGEGKHPRALGQRGPECWREIWPIISPQIDDAMSRGLASWHEDALVPIYRNGRIEEVYWTYGYSPAYDDRGRVGGTLVVCTETTSRVVAERRREVLGAVARAVGSAIAGSDLASVFADALAPFAEDVPFVMLCSVQEDAEVVVGPAAHLGEADARTLASALGPALLGVVQLAELADAPRVRAQPWPENVEAVFVTPLTDFGDTRRQVVFGLSPRLPFDTAYRRTLEDATRELVAAEAQREASRAREAGISERNNLLAELQTASRAKDEFLAMLSHELRNPLSPIVTALELMKLSEIDHKVGVQVIARQVDHLVRLVDDLLDVSRFTRGHVEIIRQPVELATAVARGIEMASPALERGGHTLEVEVATEGLVIDGDAVRLAQVFANLLTNAAKYTPAGGRITVTARRDIGEVVVHVRDNGVGIDADMIGRLFDPFAQVQQDRARSEGGLGLGLTIVKTLVEKHGGRASVVSEGRGAGSEFTVALPLSASERQAEVVAYVTPNPSQPRRKILVVDDNEDAAWMLAETLTRFGHRVRCAADGPSALSMAAQDPPEVAVVDIGLPVMDGFELAARLRELPGLAALHMIALTGYGQAGDRARSQEAGFLAHLVKPISIDALVAVLQGLQAAPLPR